MKSRLITVAVATATVMSAPAARAQHSRISQVLHPGYNRTFQASRETRNQTAP
jgi:hypothetical protein